jgi:phosphatidylinositol-3-phosphatase
LNIKPLSVGILTALLLLSGCGTQSQNQTPNQDQTATPAPSPHQTVSPQPKKAREPQPIAKKPDHVVIVVEENHSASEVIGDTSVAPYINALATQGALFTNAHAIEHPSQPNYLDLFSGSNQGVTDDSCPHTFSTPNLASELVAAHLTFTGYSEQLPSVGYTGCSYGKYARKHSPWVNFSNVPTSSNQPFTAFPTDYSKLPTVSFVIPNLNNDMHDGSRTAADSWLQTHMDAYTKWAQTHNSLLIVTWDEDDNGPANLIPTMFIGATVRPGRYGETINHFNVLRTVEDFYGLPHAGQSANVQPIKSIWKF